MDSSLVALGFLLLFVFLFGAVISGILWISYGDAVYKRMVLFWLANAGQMFLIPVVQKVTEGSLLIEGVVSLTWIGATMMPVLIYIVQDLNGEAKFSRWLVRLSFFGIGVNILGGLATQNFMVAVSAGSLFEIAPLLLVLLYLQFFKMGRKLSPVLSGFNITTMCLLVHFLDYPFLRPVESFAPFGFTIYVGIAIGLVVFMQASMIERLYQAGTEELERKVKERTSDLESFSYSVSHDLRAPIRSILGFTAILREEGADKLGATMEHALGRIENAAKRMARLIDGLLELSRIGRTDLQVGVIDFTNSVTQILDELRESEPGRNVEMIIRPGVTAHGDVRMLRTLVENLLRNAWKYSRNAERGLIEFGSEVNEQKQVIYFVRDNGVGFDMTHSEQLFRAFHRLHAEKDFEGTGIGLATAHRIVARHGGSIWAEGKVGQGARFSFTIPPGGPSITRG